MENRTLIAIPLMMGSLLLPLGCGILGPRTLLEPSELCSDHGNSDIATFEDPNMERAVRDWSGARNDLTCGLVSGFEGITFHGYGITSLVGIQNLTSLGSLELGNNLITDISPLRGLTSLEYLQLYDNSITDISPLGGLTRLWEITLYNNSITDISALGGLTSLTWLHLSNNPDLSNIQPLLDNTGLGRPVSTTFGFFGRQVRLRATNVSCTDVAALEAKGVDVWSDCP